MTFLNWLSNGLWDLSGWGIVVYTLIMTHITIVTVTVYLHRSQAHRALDLHPALNHFFRFWNWLTTSMSTAQWVSVHRKHHAACETEDDPHSPQVQGIGEIFWRGTEAYQAAATPETIAKYGSGTPNDWVENNVYRRFTFHGIALLALIDIALFGAIGLTVWAVQMLWIPVTAAGVINGIGHYWGYRNYECGDAARNISPWGILIGGEELHNNHHTYPNSAKLSQRSWEFDIGWFWIRLFEILGLAKVRSTGPVSEQVPGKAELDRDTAWALANDRFQVMAKYAERVVSPLVRHESASASATEKDRYRRAHKLLCREESLVDEAGRSRIAELTNASPNLKLVYEMRLRLQGLWAQRAAGAEALLTGLKSWCADAEATGNQALQEFAAHLKSYSMPEAAQA
ncbi:MAG: DesA family fatty acid desaturase [Pseudomonadales bacterium]